MHALSRRSTISKNNRPHGESNSKFEQFSDSIRSGRNNDEHQFADSRQTIECANSFEESKEGILEDIEMIKTNDLVPSGCGSSDLKNECGEVNFIKKELECDDDSPIHTTESANYQLVSSMTIDCPNEKSKETIFTYTDEVKTEDRLPNKCGSSELSVDCGEMSFIKNKPEFIDINQYSGGKHEAALLCHKKLKSDFLRFKCDICEDTFVYRDSLEIHKKRHSDEKSLECIICRKLFSQRDFLNAHIMSHTVEEPPEFECDICGEFFSFLSSLKIHFRIHAGEKPFKCDVCEMTFIRRKQLKLHSRKHLNEIPVKFTLKAHSETQRCPTSANRIEQNHDRGSDSVDPILGKIKLNSEILSILNGTGGSRNVPCVNETTKKKSLENPNVGLDSVSFVSSQIAQNSEDSLNVSAVTISTGSADQQTCSKITALAALNTKY